MGKQALFIEVKCTEGTFQYLLQFMITKPPKYPFLKLMNIFICLNESVKQQRVIQNIMKTF